MTGVWIELRGRDGPLTHQGLALAIDTSPIEQSRAADTALLLEWTGEVYSLRSVAGSAPLAAAPLPLQQQQQQQQGTSAPDLSGLTLISDGHGRVALQRLSDGAFLQQRGGAAAAFAQAGRPSWWQLRELGLPACTAAPLPLRVTLRSAGCFLSHGGAPAVANGDAAAPACREAVACCSEARAGQLALLQIADVQMDGRPHALKKFGSPEDLPARRIQEWLLELAPTGGGLAREACLWTGDARRLLAASDADPAALLLRDAQRLSGGGREVFHLRLEPRPAAAVSLWSRTVPLGLARGGGRLAASADGRPARFDLALAGGGWPSLLVSAHAQAVGAAPGEPARAAALRPTSAAEAAAQGLVFSHHADSVYSVRQAGDGVGARHLCVDERGSPALSDRLQFPHPRCLWVLRLVALPVGGGTAAAAPPPCGFVSLSAEDREPPTVLGWTLRTKTRVAGERWAALLLSGAALVAVVAAVAGGRLAAPAPILPPSPSLHSTPAAGKHRYLSAHPSGLLTTSTRVSRWELFSIADLQACLSSPARPLQHLLRPQAAAATVAQPRPRTLPMLCRSASAAALASARGAAGGPRLQTVRSTPSLARIPEEGGSGGRGTAPCQPLSARGAPPRRCRSEPCFTALAERRRTPRLAELSRLPAGPTGWGVRSPATLVELLTRRLAAEQLAAAAAAAGGPDPGLAPGPHAAEGLAAALAAVPAELVAAVEAEASALAAPPASDPGGTKLSGRQLAKLAGVGGLPAWAGRKLLEALPPRTDCFACAACRGASGALLLQDDAERNPGHHAFLAGVERAAAGRARLLAARDGVVMGLQVPPRFIYQVH